MPRSLKYRIFLIIFVVGNISLFSQCIDSTLIDADHNSFCLNVDISSEYDFSHYNGIEYYPVCGCDGKTYANPICAETVGGFTSWTMGPCSCIDSMAYDSAYFVNDQGRFSSPNEIMNLVCGCDSTTYLSYVHAIKNGVMMWDEGPCACVDSTVIDTSVVCDSLYFDIFWNYRVFGCDGNWYDSACEAYYHHGVTNFFFYLSDFYCDIDSSLIDSVYDCGQDYDPVCGCDFITYDNACIAEKYHGVYQYYEGECDCRDPEPIISSGCSLHDDYDDYKPVCGCDGKTYVNPCHVFLNGILILSDGPCQECIDSSVMVEDVTCANFNDKRFLCGCDGKLYESFCDAYYRHGIVEFRDCDCIEDIAIDNEKECFETSQYNPVCGCDGHSYPNPCYATYKAGVTSYQIGLCPNTCRDSTLIIHDMPCADIQDPVCGCDSVTYINECHARFLNGIVEWTYGKCMTSSTTENEIFGNQDILIFPNPATEAITLQLNSTVDHKDLQFIIVDQIGRVTEVIILESYESSLRIDISHLSKGIYFISDRSGKLRPMKFVK